MFEPCAMLVNDLVNNIDNDLVNDHKFSKVFTRFQKLITVTDSHGPLLEMLSHLKKNFRQIFLVFLLVDNMKENIIFVLECICQSVTTRNVLKEFREI